MAYDHSRKIGNEGDVAKHAVLHNCVEHLLGRLSLQGVFVYGDSHSGRPVYVLPECEEWPTGIQAVSLLTKSTLEGHPRIDSYRQALIPDKRQAGQTYFGSSGVVFRCVRQQGKACRFHLFELDPHAHDDLVRYFFPWRDVVGVTQGDGYRGVMGLEAASLVLVDPPGSEYEPVAECLETLHNRSISFLCWTPRNPSSVGVRQESGKGLRFREECVVARHFPVRWSEPTGHSRNTFGCCLSVSRDLENIADETIASLVTLLADKGWSRE